MFKSQISNLKSQIALLLTLCCCIGAAAQTEGSATAAKLDSCLTLFFDNYKCDFRAGLPVTYDRYVVNDSLQTLDIYTKEGFASQVFTPEKVSAAYADLRRLLPIPYYNYNIRLYGFGREISSLVPNAYRSDKDSSRLWRADNSGGGEWVRNVSRPVLFEKGLQGCHLTVWPSHGRYYDSAKKRWRWQRPNLWCTTEDMFTRSIVVPFLLPMLESAGAVAYCPRERDWHTQEVLGRVEGGGEPFQPNLDHAGDYAVYVRYADSAQATGDAVYTVRHGGVETDIRVNQQMGAGVWAYLGTFHFDQGRSKANYIRLSSGLPSEVRVGGGMGSVERDGTPSGMPRFLEGSRYWAEYAGFPNHVYYTKDGNNDYADDINVRSNVVNYLAGGSPYMPDTAGLRVPMELSLAVHSDAGYFKENRPFGTLAIYTISGDGGTDSLLSGVSRMANSDLACMMQADICRDLTAALGAEWPRRAIYNRNYSESRKPEVPSIILESLSHQNFQDMVYGHDPVFKLLFARAIYKSIVRFVATMHGRDYTIQPLPVTHFRADALDGQVRLCWRAQADSLEPTADPTGYIVYTAREGEDFDNGTLVSGGLTELTVSVDRDKVYRFRVTAVNDGGESWPSETLAALSASHEEDRVLIINAFTRLSAPAVVETAETQGFDILADIGVPYINTAEYCGAQTGFLRANIGRETEGGLGFSTSELEGRVIAGNTFDYPYLHALALRSDDGTRSISSQAVGSESESLKFNVNVSLIDIILGLQKDDGPSSLVKYKTFTPELRAMIADYLRSGGNVVVSGANVASDMLAAEEQKFTADILGYTLAERTTEHKLKIGGTHFSLVNEWNPYRYAVQGTDALQPQGSAEPLMKYHGGACAAVSTDNTVVMGFPLEAVRDAADRHTIMNRVVQKLLYKF